MNICPVCRLNNKDFIKVCRCGYDYGEEKIIDEAKLREYQSQLKREKDWVKEVELIRAVHQIQLKIHQNDWIGWRIKDIAKMFNASRSLISTDIKLAIALGNNPELKNCKNKSEAKDQQSESPFKEIFKQYTTEDLFQKYLKENWGQTPFNDEWELWDKELNAEDLKTAGKIDLIARHRKEKSWLVIEIKKQTAPDRTVGQISRYMGWIKEKHAGSDEKVSGMIISGFPPDKNIRYALSTTPDIDYKIYYRFSYLGTYFETKFMCMEDAFKIQNGKIPSHIKDEIKQFVKKAKGESNEN